MAKRTHIKGLFALMEKAGASERVIRMRAPTEPLWSMFDCDICCSLPSYVTVKEDSAVEETVSMLEFTHVLSEDLGNSAYCTYAVGKCPNRAALYMAFYLYDAEDSHVEPPTSRTDLWRLNLRYADELLRSVDQAAEADALQARYPALIEDIRQRMGKRIPANFLPHMVDALVDQAIAENDWTRLKQELLDHPKPAVGLRALTGLLRLISTSPSDDKIPRTRHRRPITHTTCAQSVPFIQANFAELRAELEKRQPLGDWRVQRMCERLLSAPEQYGLT